MSTLLVTGGAGFIGSHVVRAAHQAGRRLVVLDDLSAGELPSSSPGVFRQVDIADRPLIRQLIHDHHVTSVIHLAGKICVGESVQHPSLYFDHNLARTIALLDVVLECRVKAFVFSSSAAVYGDAVDLRLRETSEPAPTSPYGWSKLAVEHILDAYGRAHGLPWAALRYFNACGAHPDGTLRENHNPETHLIPLAIDAALGHRDPLVLFGTDYATRDGTAIRDYVHVCDVAQAHLAALAALEAGRAVGAVNLGSGVGYSVREIIDETSRVLARPVPHVLGARRSGDPASLVADISRAVELFGWRPRSTLAALIGDAARTRV